MRRGGRDSRWGRRVAPYGIVGWSSPGGVAERSNAPVLKTGVRHHRTAGSNPAPSAQLAESVEFAALCGVDRQRGAQTPETDQGRWRPREPAICVPRMSRSSRCGVLWGTVVIHADETARAAGPCAACSPAVAGPCRSDEPCRVSQASRGAIGTMLSGRTSMARRLPSVASHSERVRRPARTTLALLVR